MEVFHIAGGARLEGTVAASGSKNAVLPMMAASILTDEPLCLQAAPRVTDVCTLARVLGELGVRVERRDGDLVLQTVDRTPIRAGYAWVRRMRAGFCVLGPLLARCGRAVVSLPGGCRIGDRPVDLHLKGLAALGAELRLERGYVVARARRLVGAKIDLAGPRGPTVTGTANVLCAAVLARGTTVLTGAAREPEIVDLGGLLNAMGARIAGLGTSTLEVRGVESLGGATWRVIPDRIEAATLLIAAAITRGSATVTGVVPEHLDAVLAGLSAAGFAVRTGRDWVWLACDGQFSAVDITAAPYPGVPTDVQAQWTALMCLASGASRVRDAVFAERFSHVAELRRLGAQIRRSPDAADIIGASRLRGAVVTASDLRASAALVLAGLAAEGHTTVRRVEHLDRGYEGLDQKLNQLGAAILRSGDRSGRARRGSPDPAAFLGTCAEIACANCRVGPGRLGGRQPTETKLRWWSCARWRALVPPWPAQKMAGA